MNASRLQQEVSRRLQRLQEIVDDGVRIGVPRPQLQPADADGCNWTMKHFGNAAGFDAAIAQVLAQVRAEYNLAEDDAHAPAARRDDADPFGGAATRNERVNPFADDAKETGRVNPFGDAPPARTGDPFASPAADALPQQRPRDPFADGD